MNSSKKLIVYNPTHTFMNVKTMRNPMKRLQVKYNKISSNLMNY